MNLFYFAISYLSLTAFFIFILLFGESPVFRGTPVAWLHWLVTSGLCNGAEYLVARLFGSRGTRAVEGCLTACCERPNPALQAAYLVMVVGGYVIYWTHLFALLPNPWVDQGHILSGSASVLLCLALFVAASASDPGTVRAQPPEELAAWHRLYPLDGALFPPKECPTCHLMRPARSKHCRVCNRCVGRHDHHCQWINNCVGFNNLRIFLAFLGANLAMCTYGAVLAVLILGGEMDRRGMFSVRLIHYRSGRVLPLWKIPSKLIEWLVVFYPVAVAMALFMAVASLLMLAFLSYQIYLLVIGRTQYEVFKWRDLHHAMLEAAEEQARQPPPPPSSSSPHQQGQQRPRRQQGQGQGQSDEVDPTSNPTSSPGVAVGDGKGGGRGQGGGRGSGVWGRLWGGQEGGRRPRVELPPNIYNRGFLVNAWEVMVPELHLERAREAVRAGREATAGAGTGAAGPGRGAAVRGSDRDGGQGSGGAAKGKWAKGDGKKVQ